MRLLCALCLLCGLHAAAQSTITSIELKGNKRTRDFVLLRELPFEVGDTVSAESLAELKTVAERNLTNTGLFNFTTVTFSPADGGYHALVEVVERWYVWPGILFSLAETNFNTWWQTKDFERVNYGVSLIDLNSRGRREKLTFNFQGGWTQKFGLTYQAPYLNKARTLGGGLEAYYANNREVNIGSLANKRTFLKEDRFLKEEIITNLKLEWRPELQNTHRFIAGFHTVNVSDTVVDASAAYMPAGRTQAQYVYLAYGFRREMRDNRAYPLTGYIIDGSLDQRGIGYPDAGGLALTEASLTVNMHHHLRGRWYFGHGIKSKTTLAGTPPYYLQRGLGYGNTFVRGTQLYVVDAQHFVLYKSNLKLQVIKKRNVDLGMSGLNKFDKFHYSLYLNLFADAGYGADKLNAITNPLANQWLSSIGLGLDLVTYYDVVIRLEFSFNSLGEFGLFPNFQNPI